MIQKKLIVAALLAASSAHAATLRCDFLNSQRQVVKTQVMMTEPSLTSMTFDDEVLKVSGPAIAYDTSNPMQFMVQLKEIDGNGPAKNASGLNFVQGESVRCQIVLF
jgi:hypothetical protein